MKLLCWSCVVQANFCQTLQSVSSRFYTKQIPLGDSTWENEKWFPEVNKTQLYMFDVLIYCMNDFQFLLELAWKNCNNFYPEMSRSRHDWVCEVQNKKAIEKYVKLSFALAVITGSDSFSCEKNRFLQSRLQRVSWACWQEWFEHVLLT